MLTLKLKIMQKQMLWNKHPFITVKAVVFKHPAFFWGQLPVAGSLDRTAKQEANNKIPTDKNDIFGAHQK